MKKETKNLILVVFIALSMFFSSAAFVIMSAIPGGDDTANAQTQIPDTLVIEGRLAEDTRLQLLRNGATIMEWHYYDGCCADLQSFVDGLPAELDYQILIEKISDSNADKGTWANATSLRGEKNWSTPTYDSFVMPLCGILLKPPVECGLAKFSNQSA